ncbi:unnamed protein product [Thelazia callipaeda]|uniref:Phosphoglycolate phosphatase n=1 Tax=Thelazia callipaeda TaxID=103827 RepID=A0A0N5CL62_THECL|nr:unnamed protein product [Thelazia callipaeda]
MWVPWAENVAKKISEMIEMSVENEIYLVLGLEIENKIVRSGLLAMSTIAKISDAITRLLIKHGIDSERAFKCVKTAIQESSKANVHTTKEVCDLRLLFGQLRDNGIKIAICTSDSRKETLNALRKLEIENYVEMVVCGDDAGAVPKPHPHNALSICQTLDVDPKINTLVVGDTLADLGMGRSANLGATVGVLSGVCGSDELRPQADYIIKDVSELLPLALDMKARSLS